LYKSKYKNTFVVHKQKENQMNYVITGSIGHISRPVVEKLVAAGHNVKVISSNAARSKEIETLGATPLIGSVEDVSFLRDAFAGADAVYTMVPPTFSTSNWKKHLETVGKNYAAALKGSTVKHVVNLSSVGAHLAAGCGPVSGLYGAEQALNGLEGVNVLHLRPGFFYSNFYSNIGMIKHMGIIGGNFGNGTKLVMSNTNDIAEVVANQLLKPAFMGKSVLYTSSDEKTTDEIAMALGKAIGKPDLKWVDFTDEQSTGGMIQAGLPQEIAENYTEMGSAMRNGTMFDEYFATKQKPSGKSKFETFASEFAAVYNQ
jgi:uncharacterized protein YbjT (DUF2867 family)